jgi:AcrR family transcriptional regulator
MASPERSYTSPVREDQARQTRKRIVDAAAALFAERGYGATTIDAIAQAAGVSRKTVFDSVGGKANLMKLAYDFAITGDDAPTPLMDRPRIADLMAEREPAAMIAGHATLVTEVGSRIAAIYCALEQAAGTDAEARALYQALVRQRRTSMDIPARVLAEAGAGRPGLTPTQVADLLWIYSDPALYDKLVGQQGWSAKQFEQWLCRTLEQQLLEY